MVGSYSCNASFYENNKSNVRFSICGFFFGFLVTFIVVFRAVYSNNYIVSFFGVLICVLFTLKYYYEIVFQKGKKINNTIINVDFAQDYISIKTLNFKFLGFKIYSSKHISSNFKIYFHKTENYNVVKNDLNVYEFITEKEETYYLYPYYFDEELTKCLNFVLASDSPSL